MSLGRAFKALTTIGDSLVPEGRVPSGLPPSIQAPIIRDQSTNPNSKAWEMLAKPPEEWDLDAMYAAYRGGPVSAQPFVAIIIPKYGELDAVTEKSRLSRNEVRVDLDRHGIGSGTGSIVGDSLVCRMRQRACHNFLVSPATHLLFWDADIECLTPDCVRHMLASGHDVVAGACPFKDMSGRTVHNLFPDTDPSKLTPDESGCIEVQDAGTGFMLVSRRCLYAMQKAYPTLIHTSMTRATDRGAPLWALFDTGVVAGVYQSEDYLFCARWQQLGGSAHVYVPARFRHWGLHGYEASFAQQYGLTSKERA